MTDERLLELFDEFKSAFDAGAAPDVRRYLDRAGQNSGALLLMIDRYMASVPMPALNEDALERAMQDTDAIQRLFRALPPASAAPPEGVSAGRWEKLVERFREWAVAGVDARLSGAVATLDPEMPHRDFGPGVRISSVTDEPGRSELRVLHEVLDALDGESVVALVQDANGDILAKEVVDPEGIAVLDIDPRKATSDDVLVALVGIRGEDEHSK